MNELIIKGTDTTPEIHFNPRSGILMMSGKAYSANINVFYQTLDAWLEEYLISPCEVTTVELYLDYTNSVFSKLLLVFLGKCKKAIPDPNRLLIRWYHHEDDPDAVDDIIRISKMIQFPIEPVQFP